MTYKKHSYNILPEHTLDQRKELVESIDKYGCIKPIMLYPEEDGSLAVLDGWNTYKICLELGKIPKFDQFKGSKEEALIYSKNMNFVKGRELTKSQKAALALEFDSLFNFVKEETEKAKVEKLKQSMKGNSNAKKEKVVVDEDEIFKPEKKKQESKTTLKTLADQFDVSESLLKQAKNMKEENPEMFKEVSKGTTSIYEVNKATQEKKNETKNPLQVKYSEFVKDFKSSFGAVENRTTRETPRAFYDFISSLRKVKDAIESWENPSKDCLECGGTGKAIVNEKEIQCPRCGGLGKVGTYL